jgi:predicted SAM-dependent methyltransferase
MQILEHVSEDTTALSECHRILILKGRCLITIPINKNRVETMMNPNFYTAERLDCYGQKDHVRIYGTDITDKLDTTGFRKISRITPDTILSKKEMEWHSIKTSYPFHNYQSCDDLFVCAK